MDLREYEEWLDSDECDELANAYAEAGYETDDETRVLQVN